MLKHYAPLLVVLLLVACRPAPIATPQAVEVTVTATPSALHGSISANVVEVSDDVIRFAGTSTLPEATCLQTQLFAEGVPETWWPLDTCVPVTGQAWEITVALDALLDQNRNYTLRAWAFDDPAIQSETFWLEVSPPPSPTATPSTPPPAPLSLLPQPPLTPPPPGWTPTRLPPYNSERDTPEERTRVYLRLVFDMLNAAADVDTVLAELASWMMQDSTYEGDLPPNAWVIVHDLDGDGVEEWLISVPTPDTGCYVGYCPGYVFLAAREGDLFIPLQLIASSMELEGTSAPTLLKIADINADGHLEVVLEETHCGAHTCFTTLHIGQWDGARWHDLAADPISQAFTDYTLQDKDGDGREEITMFGGLIGSAGAGMQRPRTLRFAWREGAYRLISDEPAPDEHAYFLMLDAHTALVAGEWERALELAEGVLEQASDFQPTDWMTARDWTRVFGYSAIEALLVHAHQGDLLAMNEVMADLLAHDLITAENPYREGAAQLLETYRATGDVLAACRAMEATLLSYPAESREFFEWYGYNTERLPWNQYCPLDAAGE